jgi:hypothetical protein
LGQRQSRVENVTRGRYNFRPTARVRSTANFAPPDLELESILRRRDRKRRNQRIKAAVVGIAVFVAAVWIVPSAGSFDRRGAVVEALPAPGSGLRTDGHLV